ncbi:uncharacterized protein LOC144100681 [Amblyomma americanum]
MAMFSRAALQPLREMSFNAQNLSSWGGLHLECNTDHERYRPRLYPDTFDAFDGFTFRTVGKATDPNGPYQISISSTTNGFASMELISGKVRSVVSSKATDVTSVSSHKIDDIKFRADQTFSFAIRAHKDRDGNDAFQCLVADDVVNEVAFSWSGVRISEYLMNRTVARLSLHLYNDHMPAFPVPMGVLLCIHTRTGNS